MKRVLIIEPSGKLYGSEMVLLDIIKNTSLNKYKFTIVLPPNSEFISHLEKNNFEHVDILDISNGIKKVISYIRLFHLIRKSRPDLIFVNQAGIQKIISHIANFLNISVVTEVSTLEDGILISNFNSKLHKQVKAYICNSDFIASRVQIPKDKKCVLYYGYEWKNLNPVINYKKNPFNIALLGRISESKGHFLLVEAIKSLKTRRDDINIQIYFIGDAPTPTIETNIRNIISNYALENLFVFRGFQTDIGKELNNMNVMVIPSIQEPFGRIYCESAEAKLPCIVANSGGLGELAQRFNLGIQFEGKNSHDLSLKIEYCFDNYEQIKIDFQQNAHSILHRLNKKEYVNVIEKIFDRAIENENISFNWYGSDSSK